MICYTCKIFDLHFIIYLWKFLLFTVYFALSYVLLLLIFFNLINISYNNRVDNVTVLQGISYGVLIPKCSIFCLHLYVSTMYRDEIEGWWKVPKKKKKLQKDERMISPSLSLSLNTSEYEHTQHWKTCWSNMLDMFIVK